MNVVVPAVVVAVVVAAHAPALVVAVVAAGVGAGAGAGAALELFATHVEVSLARPLSSVGAPLPHAATRQKLILLLLLHQQVLLQLLFLLNNNILRRTRIMLTLGSLVGLGHVPHIRHPVALLEILLVVILHRIPGQSSSLQSKVKHGHNPFHRITPTLCRCGAHDYHSVQV